MGGLFDGNRQGIGCAGIIALLVLYALFSGGHKSGSSSAAPQSAPPTSTTRHQAAPAPPPPQPHTVRYLVTTELGVGNSSITYQNDQGGTEQVDYQGDWDKVYTLPPGAFVYVAAQNDHDYGSVECAIFVDGQQWKHSTSTAAYGIATCSGEVPS